MNKGGGKQLALGIDFLQFKSYMTSKRSEIYHSAKGSTWEHHKYIKKVDGTYYYPDNYKGGNKDTKTFDEFESFSKDLMKKGKAYWDDKEVAELSKEELGELYEDMTGVKLGKEDLDRLYNSREAKYNQSSNNLSENDVDKLAKEVIKGNFGNGQIRKDLLGEDYNKVQSRVNELLKGKIGKKKV